MPHETKRDHVLRAMLVSFILLLTACQSGSTPSEATPTPPETEVAIHPGGVFETAQCWFDVPDGTAIECGYLVVPEDHFQSTARRVRLAVVILRDQSEAHQPDPVILLAGGPGERVVANALGLS